LWAETQGDPDICIAILDGPVDRLHPAIRGANLVQLKTLVPGAADDGPACRHGTHIASVIFGQHDGPVRGIASGCRGVVVPVFESVSAASYRACSQLDLARALGQAVQHGARVINVSGGQFSPSGTAHPILADAVAVCARRGVLIVAAVGNEGCACLHVPAALDSVLAVGAMTAAGEPLEFSNWGGPYQLQGILAPGEMILGAQPGGGTARLTGTSLATAIVSGVVALLLSLQRRRGIEPDARLVRAALLRSARGCDDQPTTDCRRLLAGRLNVKGAVSIINDQGKNTMSDAVSTEQSPIALVQSGVEPGAQSMGDSLAPPAAGGPGLSAVQPAACSCQGANGAPQLVYVIGQIGYDLVSEARLDSLAQKMAGVAGNTTPERVAAFQPAALLGYLEAHPWDAAAVEWTLSLDGTPIYAIRPQGPFAAETYLELRRFLRAQLEEGVERISVPGAQSGKATLLMGQVVPVIVPELRGMYSWTTTALLDAVVGPAPAADAPAEAKENHEQKKTDLRSFLDRVYHALRNLGIMPADRAVNFAATNAYSAAKAFEAVLKDKERLELDSINVVRSPICRPNSDCWDVEVYFFFPERQVQTVRRVHRFTVDVSDVVPVTVGPMHSWFTR
jgi:hypothetical protein